MRIYFASVILLCTSLLMPTPASAVELFAKRGDTFIYEAQKSKEFSASDFLAVSHLKGQRAIAYLPFEAKGIDIGFDEKTDRIIIAKLTLFIKELPSLPKSNVEPASLPKPKPNELFETTALTYPTQNNLFESHTPPTSDSVKLFPENEATPTSDVAKAVVKEATDLAESTKENPKSDDKNIVKISIYGIVDDSAFEPNSKNYRVSWDGKVNAPAPKHDPIDGRLDSAGMYKLGEIELDTAKHTYYDGDRIEFDSRELNIFLNFVYGANTAQRLESDINSPVSKIENFAIVLLQESGPRAAIFYSADSFGIDADKKESGDSIDVDDNATEDELTPISQSLDFSDEKILHAKKSKNNSIIDDKELAALRRLPPENQLIEAQKYIYSGDRLTAYLLETGVLGANEADDKKVVEAPKKDFRPKIVFEHLRMIEEEQQD